MKAKTLLKRICSVALSAALLLSGMALSVPTATAVTGPASTYGNTVPSTVAPSSNNLAKYRVRLCITEENGFDKSIHDNATYTAGVSYGLNNSKRNLNGTSTADDNGDYWCEYAKISYKDLNGTGTEGAVWFNIGDKDAGSRGDIVSSGGQNYGYFPSDDGVVISGFPTSFTTRYYEKGNGDGAYHVYLQVAVWTDSNEWEWSEGTCTSTGFLGIGGWDSKFAGGVMGASTGTIATSSDGTELKLSSTLLETEKFPAAVPDVAPDCAYNVNNITCPKKAGSVRSSATLAFDSPKDQYGAVMAAQIATSCSVSAAGISQSAKTTYVSYLANLTGGKNIAQSLTATVVWPQRVTTQRLSNTATLEIRNATYEVIWKNHAGTEIANDTYAYGEMPYRDVPQREYDSYHYLDASWDHAYEAVTDTSNNVYTASYTVAEHQYSGFVYVDASCHKATCYADAAHIHTETFSHNMQSETIAPSCTQKGYVKHFCTDCGYHYESDETAALGHVWDSGVITEQATCFANGIKTYTCTRCGETRTELLGILEHEPVLEQLLPSDKSAGGVYYRCAYCGKYWGAVYSERLHDYDVPEEEPVDTLEQALAMSDALPAPFFNIYTDTAAPYDYSTRGASLKYISLKTPDYQPLRFAASVRVPAGVDYRIGEEGNCITDIGFVYTQTRFIGDDVNNLEVGKDHVYRISLKDKNITKPAYNGSNWGGITTHEAQDGTHLTCNLVINIKAENWSKDYCARAYVKYLFNGFEYTVYDEVYSTKSVEYVARQAVANPLETQQARDYCQNVILDNLFE